MTASTSPKKDDVAIAAPAVVPAAVTPVVDKKDEAVKAPVASDSKK